MSTYNVSQKTIALVDWAWVGHHPSYYILFVQALLELGHRVVAMCPEGDAASAVAERFEQECQSDTLSILPCQRISWVPRFLPSRLLLQGVHEMICQLRTFRAIHRQLSQWEREQSLSVDLVFFACIYDIHFRYFHLAWRLNPRPWSGLYLHCRAFRKPGTPIPGPQQIFPCPERFLKANGHRGLAILDEGVTEKVAALSGKPVIAIPDLTDERLSSYPSILADKIQQQADSRPIILSIGHLQYTKGCGTLARVAERATLNNVMFAFTGDVIWHTFSEEDQARLSSLQASQGNVLTHFKHIPDGEFNSVFRSCDIIFAAYLDFPNSSNLLAKAAVFEKPVIVSDGSLMAERTREYRLGEIIPEGDVDAAERALVELTKDLPGWIERNQPRWAVYRKLHSFETLKTCFAKLLAASDES